MIDAYGRWYPDFPGQQPWHDPGYLRSGNQAQQPDAQSTSAQSQLQNGGLVRIQNEQAARMYPVAAGTSVTFIDNSAPYCYEKIMGMSQLEPPRFVRYRLIKEYDSHERPQAASDNHAQAADLSAYATKADVDAIRQDISVLRAQVDAVSCSQQMTTGGDDNG